nr:MAG TPA: hypothetical protein [Caudoviricetes sp.]
MFAFLTKKLHNFYSSPPIKSYSSRVYSVFPLLSGGDHQTDNIVF